MMLSDRMAQILMVKWAILRFWCSKKTCAQCFPAASVTSWWERVFLGHSASHCTCTVLPLCQIGFKAGPSSWGLELMSPQLNLDAGPCGALPKVFSPCEMLLRWKCGSWQRFFFYFAQDSISQPARLYSDIVSSPSGMNYMDANALEFTKQTDWTASTGSRWNHNTPDPLLYSRAAG